MPLVVSDLITAINSLVDDSIDPGTIVYWINDAIGKMNEAMNAGFPYADVTKTTDSLIFPDMWQRSIIVPYAAAKAKQQDSSQFEYTDMYNEALASLTDFQAKYRVPVQYKLLDPDQTITVNSANYTPNYGDTLQSVADANNTTYQDIITANTTPATNPTISYVFGDVIGQTAPGTVNILYIEKHPEADYLSNPPYLYGGW